MFCVLYYRTDSMKAARRSISLHPPGVTMDLFSGNITVLNWKECLFIKRTLFALYTFHHIQLCYTECSLIKPKHAPVIVYVDILVYHVRLVLSTLGFCSTHKQSLYPFAFPSLQDGVVLVTTHYSHAAWISNFGCCSITRREML